MNIYSYELGQLDKLKQFIAQSNYLPFLEYSISRDLINDYVVKELSDISSSGGSVFVAQEAEKIIGIVSSEKLEWDSKHFDIESSKISYLIASGDYFKSLHIKQKLISHLIGNYYDSLTLHSSIRVNKEDLSSIHALESNSFQLMDVLVTYSLDLRNQNGRERPSSLPIRRFKKSDLPELVEISVECFRKMPTATDRFHADPVLSKEKSDELYTKWLINFSQDHSNEILVAEVDGKLVGFNLCTVNKLIAEKIGLRIGSMVLTGVISSERNRGIGHSLLNASISWFRNKVDIIESGGQVSNYPIQRAWSKAGFKITKSQCTFHWSVLPDNA